MVDSPDSFLLDVLRAYAVRHPEDGRPGAVVHIMQGTTPPPDTYAANVIEAAAHRIRKSRQEAAR